MFARPQLVLDIVVVAAALSGFGVSATVGALRPEGDLAAGVAVGGLDVLVLALVAWEVGAVGG